ncbi:MAG: ATP-binding cassette domain-containing protein [Rhodocyclaceae bacterium]|nr:ATP-binding cassette domain-containing protein [Rhodocyclaceae bacterium]MBK9625965.1 ATP-binding cassette domain-containing protein [Rhodocyclaceae bacterium]MBL0074688.1 ATP-binding cassette domain-containing protein [Rhodocyclaceae bacterium]MBP6109098.1 ATP-binding cassette domain-containing protein [Rhodocyclaceae bacterium]MBP6278821.1 ATP-binding cassette domain-containing protein [Rhodocyclaceae bacterium]
MSTPLLPLLDVRDLKVHFNVGRTGFMPWSPPRLLRAVDGVSFTVNAGETLGIVGESGCGKSSLARALIGLNPIASGDALFAGQSLRGLSKQQWHEMRANMQMIFQDPLSSLDPRMTIGNIIAEPLQAQRPDMSRAEIKAQVEQVMERVGLLSNVINRYPHEFSGGQCQRVGIARALVVKPKLIICDEPVSALDVSIQAQVINLLMDLQRSDGLALVFIAHDLAVVKHIADKVVVMYLGRTMETAPTNALFDTPRHPYTRALLSAVPVPDPDIERNKVVQILDGDIPSPINPPSGCVFRTRCPQADAACGEAVPTLNVIAAMHQVACLKMSA